MGTVVATDPVSINADCDNGSAALHGPARRRRDEEREAHRVARARKRRPGNTRPGRCGSGRGESLCTLPTCGDRDLVITGSRVGVLIYLNRLMRDAAYEVRRIILPRTRVNKPDHAHRHPLATAGSQEDHPLEGCANTNKSHTAFVVGKNLTAVRRRRSCL